MQWWETTLVVIRIGPIGSQSHTSPHGAKSLNFSLSHIAHYIVAQQYPQLPRLNCTITTPARKKYINIYIYLFFKIIFFFNRWELNIVIVRIIKL